jgi:hypothetical protein
MTTACVLLLLLLLLPSLPSPMHDEHSIVLSNQRLCSAVS